MPLYDPYKLVNPYRDAFTIAPLPPTVKLETAAETLYEAESKGLHIETAQAVKVNRGEMETETQQGDYLRVSVPVVTETESYYQEIVVTDIGAGETALIPVVDSSDPEVPYSEPVAIGGVPETASNYNPYNESDPFYTAETGAGFIPHEVEFYPVDPAQYNPEQYASIEAGQAFLQEEQNA